MVQFLAFSVLQYLIHYLPGKRWSTGQYNTHQIGKNRFSSKNYPGSRSGIEGVSERLKLSSITNATCGVCWKERNLAHDHGLWSTTKLLCAKMTRLAISCRVPKSAVREGSSIIGCRLFAIAPQGTGLLPELHCFLYMLFILSGYKAKIEICDLVRDQLAINTFRKFWVYVVMSVRFLALLALPGGMIVLMAAGLFFCKRKTWKNFWWWLGPGMDCLPLCSVLRTSFGQEGLSLDSNYITSLTSTTATGAWDNICSDVSYLTKGKGGIISFRGARFIMQKRGYMSAYIENSWGWGLTASSTCSFSSCSIILSIISLSNIGFKNPLSLLSSS